MAQKLVFDKLKTEKSSIKITFDGIGYQSYDVATLKSEGLVIPETCSNFDAIKIKGKKDIKLNKLCYLVMDFSNIFYKDSKIKRVKIANNISTIPDNAFKDCNNLTSITIPNSVTSIKYQAFQNCYSLTSITIPNSVTKIEERAFYGCSSLANIEINENFYIKDNILFNKDKTTIISYCNSSSTSYEIPNTVTSIGSEAFYYCSNLIAILIPNSITKIDSQAFANCSSLIAIYYTGTEEQWNAITKGSNWNQNCPENMVIYYNYVEE